MFTVVSLFFSLSYSTDAFSATAYTASLFLKLLLKYLRSISLNSTSGSAITSMPASNILGRYPMFCRSDLGVLFTICKVTYFVSSSSDTSNRMSIAQWALTASGLAEHFNLKWSSSTRSLKYISASRTIQISSLISPATRFSRSDILSSRCCLPALRFSNEISIPSPRTFSISTFL